MSGAPDDTQPLPPSQGFLGVLVCGCAVVGVLILLVAAGAWVLRRPAPYVRPGSRSLQTIIKAQERFRAEDLDRDGVQDYGTLMELSQAGLIDSALGSGEKYGYRFEVAPSSPTSPEFFWMAVANPMHPEIDDRSFATTHEGHIGYRRGTIMLNQSCKLPEDLHLLSGEPLGSDGE